MLENNIGVSELQIAVADRAKTSGPELTQGLWRMGRGGSVGVKGVFKVSVGGRGGGEVAKLCNPQSRK